MRTLPAAALLLLALAHTPAQARAHDCGRLFLGGQAPAVGVQQPGQRHALCFTAFAVLVSGTARDPLWSAEHLTAHYARIAPFRRRAGSFHPERRLPSEDRAYPHDYGRGWDRGHMTPAGDIASRRAKDQTFSMANVVPQRPNLNRGIWEGIEIAVRHLAERTGAVYIVTGPMLRPDDARTPNGRVEIPSSTWKAIYDPATRQSGAWICTNSNAPRCRAVSLAALRQDVGVTAFPALTLAEQEAPPDLPAPMPRKPYAHDDQHWR